MTSLFDGFLSVYHVRHLLGFRLWEGIGDSMGKKLSHCFKQKSIRFHVWKLEKQISWSPSPEIFFAGISRNDCGNRSIFVMMINVGLGFYMEWMVALSYLWSIFPFSFSFYFSFAFFSSFDKFQHIETALFDTFLRYPALNCDMSSNQKGLKSNICFTEQTYFIRSILRIKTSQN